MHHSGRGIHLVVDFLNVLIQVNIFNLNWCTNTNLIIFGHVWINVTFCIAATEDICAIVCHDEHIEVEGAKKDDVVGSGKECHNYVL